MINISGSGSFKKTEQFLARMKTGVVFSILDKYGRIGCDALASATPTDSGLTAQSWTYEVTKKRGQYAIVFHNTNVNTGIPVAILIQYGHATTSGGWVEGIDYINPVIRPLFDTIAEDVWREVRNA